MAFLVELRQTKLRYKVHTRGSFLELEALLSTSAFLVYHFALVIHICGLPINIELVLLLLSVFPYSIGLIEDLDLPCRKIRLIFSAPGILVVLIRFD